MLCVWQENYAQLNIFVVLCNKHVHGFPPSLSKRGYLTYQLLLEVWLGLEARWRQALADHVAAIVYILE